MSRYRDQGKSYKNNISLGLAYSFRGSVYYHHGGKHGSMQADMVLEKELRVLHLDPQAAGRVTQGLTQAFEITKPTLVIHFLVIITSPHSAIP